MDRRGFMTLLGLGAVAAPAAVKALAAEPEMVLPDFDQRPLGPPLFQDGDMLLDGVIVREKAGVTLVNADLVGMTSKFREELLREYVKENLFSPYMGEGMQSIVKRRA